MIAPSAFAIALAATLLTVAAYAVALWAYQRSGWGLLLPVLTGAATVVALLVAMGVPYGVYREGTGLLSWLAGPATVALAFPLYRQWGRLRGIWWPVMGALLAGSVTAVVSAIGIAWLLDADWPLMMSLAPKSATMPVAMPVAESTGGAASLSAVAVALTGIAAAVLSGGLFGLLGVRSGMVRGFALGAAAHAIGTARAFQIGETAIGFAALAMSLNAIATSLLVPLIVGLL
ncbi:LrgB family protein [Alicycliphilus denitrificans]|uniref:LrgB family protein n=1 Tax=Alicycliphilus denitrificans TaxID=179636 RepID=UPI0001D9ED0F|nr:LrgB family protein [Alicycliphilus denitrificans]ADU99883.1 LrgB family protein [Alicycliphilus denitrificans BC]